MKLSKDETLWDRTKSSHSLIKFFETPALGLRYEEDYSDLLGIFELEKG